MIKEKPTPFSALVLIALFWRIVGKRIISAHQSHNRLSEIRADYLGYQFWTGAIYVSTDMSASLTIPHQDVTITVNGDYNGDVVAFENINVYLFTAAGAYMNQQLVTDANGQVVFSLPAQDYKVRADYLGGQYWSDVVNQTDQTITINEGLAAVTVIGDGY